MKAFKSDVALFVTGLSQTDIDAQIKLMQLTSKYGAVLFSEPPSDIKVTDVTEELAKLLKA
jgi:hypothetical protein